MMSLSHVAFNICRNYVVTQIEDEVDHANSAPPIKRMTKISGPISFITGLCTRGRYVPYGRVKIPS